MIAPNLYGLLTSMTITEALSHIGAEKRMNLALDKIQSALKAVGSPEKGVESIVIAGTNGKGTTTLLTSAVLTAAGRRTCTFLSPHLVHPKERFLLNGETIPEETLDRLGEEFFPLAQKIGLSFFEFLTLIFFVWAKHEKADILVLEVGLGGRLDATNVTQPLACALTSIDFDHMQYLGDTLPKILHEKLGVVPKGGSLFTAVTQGELREEICRWSTKNGVRTRFIEEIPFELKDCDWDGQNFTIENAPFRITNPNPRFVRNAVLTYQLIRSTFPEIPVQTIQEAFKSTRFPGRFETVALNPRIVLSGDHNVAGVESLLETLKRLQYKKLHILCGFSPDKEVSKMLELLKGVASTLTLTRVDSLKEIYPESYSKMHPYYKQNAEKALTDIKHTSQPDDVILFTGSLYLVGELKTKTSQQR